MNSPLPVPAKVDPGFNLEEMKAFVRKHFDDLKKIQFHGFVLWRFAGRKIVERWATLTPPQPFEP